MTTVKQRDLDDYVTIDMNDVNAALTETQRRDFDHMLNVIAAYRSLNDKMPVMDKELVDDRLVVYLETVDNDSLEVRL